MPVEIRSSLNYHMWTNSMEKLLYCTYQLGPFYAGTYTITYWYITLCTSGGPTACMHAQLQANHIPIKDTVSMPIEIRSSLNYHMWTNSMEKLLYCTYQLGPFYAGTYTITYWYITVCTSGGPTACMHAQLQANHIPIRDTVSMPVEIRSSLNYHMWTNSMEKLLYCTYQLGPYLCWNLYNNILIHYIMYQWRIPTACMHAQLQANHIPIRDTVSMPVEIRSSLNYHMWTNSMEKLLYCTYQLGPFYAGTYTITYWYITVCTSGGPTACMHAQLQANHIPIRDTVSMPIEIRS